MAEQKGDKDRLMINCSRKAYLLFYFMVIILVVIIGYILYSGLPLNYLALGGAILFIVLGFTFTELHRATHRYEIVPGYVSCYKGIFSNKYKKIALESVSDVDLRQNFIQWLLNFGTVNIYQYSEKSSFVVKNIDSPEKFVEFLKSKK